MNPHNTTTSTVVEITPPQPRSRSDCSAGLRFSLDGGSMAMPRSWLKRLQEIGHNPLGRAGSSGVGVETIGSVDSARQLVDGRHVGGWGGGAFRSGRLVHCAENRGGTGLAVGAHNAGYVHTPVSRL